MKDATACDPEFKMPIKEMPFIPNQVSALQMFENK